MLGVAASVALAGAYTAKAGQQQPGPADTITALLGEVHALRIAMEQSASVQPRVQLTLARLNIEEQRIAQLAGQLERARQELAGNSLRLLQLSNELENAEGRLPTIIEEKSRRELELVISDLKSQLKTQASSEQASRARENDALQALSTEQARWQDLNSHLDELERLLAPIPR
jgi:hypothetical protein